MPKIAVDPLNLHLVGQAMAGKTTVSGVMAKISLGWDRRTLRVASEIGRYVLKPQSREFPELPENEHVTMLIARHAEIETPEFGLAVLTDQRLAYIVRRFDRTRDGRRHAQEDFCQLAEKMPAEKYVGSAELLARMVQQHSKEPGVDLARLYRQVLVAWWTGNGDMHLKNLSMLTRERKTPRLSPAYDLVNTGIVIPGDSLALPVCGKRSDLKRRDWLTFGKYCRMSERLVAQEWGRLVELLPTALGLLERSFLSTDMRVKYAETLEARTHVLRDVA
jgi:serine/threonine-protein kinase HipA